MALSNRQRLLPLSERFTFRQHAHASASEQTQSAPPSPAKRAAKKKKAAKKRRTGLVIGEFAPDRVADAMPPGTPAADILAAKNATPPAA